MIIGCLWVSVRLTACAALACLCAAYIFALAASNTVYPGSGNAQTHLTSQDVAHAG